MAEQFKTIGRWVFVRGIWEQESDCVTFAGGETLGVTANPNVSPVVDPVPVGYARSDVYFDGGRLKTTVTLPSTGAALGHIILGWDLPSTRFVTVGIGGMTGHAYVIYGYDAEMPGHWRTLSASGNLANLKADHAEPIEVRLEGQPLTLVVDGVAVLEHILDRPLERAQIGVMAQGDAPIKFGPIEITTRTRSAFVVMQFTSPFDELFEDVIKPTCKDLDIEAYRARDIYRPSVILQDIIQGLAESNVIVAEITPTNANVFYELGYAHALGKPVILLAEQGRELPFDIKWSSGDLLRKRHSGQKRPGNRIATAPFEHIRRMKRPAREISNEWDT